MKKVKTWATATIICSLIAMVIGFAILLTGNVLAEAKSSSDDEFIKSAMIYADAGDYESAAVLYNKALEKDEDNEDALRGLGEAYYIMGYYEEAEDIYSTLTEGKNATTDDWMSLVDVELKLDDLDEAKEIVENLIDDEENADNEQIEALYEQMEVDKPVFSLKSGTYDSYQLLTVEESMGSVYYTLDGTDPTMASMKFDKPLVISAPNVNIKAIAYSPLGYCSDVVSLEYVITVPVEELTYSYNYDDYYYDDYYGYSNKPDNLYRTACNILGKYSGTIYTYELAQITELTVVGEYCDNYGDSWIFYDGYYGNYYSTYTKMGNFNTEVLKYMPFLTSLKLCYQNNVDLNYVSQLQYLEELSLLNDNITDITPLAKLTNLQRLSLGWNSIQNVEPLAQLTNLRSLGLWNNYISDISSLNGLKQMYYFDVSNNQISDISVIKNYGSVTEVWIKGNNVTDLSVLNGCSSIISIQYTGNPIENYGRWQPVSSEADVDMNEG